MGDGPEAVGQTPHLLDDQVDRLGAAVPNPLAAQCLDWSGARRNSDLATDRDSERPDSQIGRSQYDT